MFFFCALSIILLFFYDHIFFLLCSPTSKKKSFLFPFPHLYQCYQTLRDFNDDMHIFFNF